MTSDDLTPRSFASVPTAIFSETLTTRLCSEACGCMTAGRSACAPFLGRLTAFRPVPLWLRFALFLVVW